MTDREVLALALHNFKGATEGKPIPKYGRWEHWAGEMRKVIGSFTTVIEVLHYAQDLNKLPFLHREKANLPLLDACIKIMLEEFPRLADTFRLMSEDSRSQPETLGYWEKGVVSDVFLWHTWALLTCRNHAPGAKSIIEIGGGYGALARLWCLYFPVERYVIVDLPESLFFAEACLRPIFGPELGYFAGEVPDTKIILVPVDRLEQYHGECDLVLNVGSMQEMNDAFIDHYMHWLDDCGAKYFYSLNYAAQPIDDLGESRCLWGPRPSPGWATKVMQLDPAVIRIMCPHRHYLEALYVREEGPVRFCNWSALDGRAVTLPVYLEGLDLIRRQPNVTDIKLFMEIVLNSKDNLGIIPKEMCLLAELVDCEASRYVKEYRSSHSLRLVQ